MGQRGNDDGSKEEMLEFGLSANRSSLGGRGLGDFRQRNNNAFLIKEIWNCVVYLRSHP